MNNKVKIKDVIEWITYFCEDSINLYRLETLNDEFISLDDLRDFLSDKDIEEMVQHINQKVDHEKSI